MITNKRIDFPGIHALGADIIIEPAVYSHAIKNVTKHLAPGLREAHALCIFLMRLKVVKSQVRTDALDEFHERFK